MKNNINIAKNAKYHLVALCLLGNLLPAQSQERGDYFMNNNCPISLDQTIETNESSLLHTSSDWTNSPFPLETIFNNDPILYAPPSEGGNPVGIPVKDGLIEIIILVSGITLFNYWRNKKKEIKSKS